MILDAWTFIPFMMIMLLAGLQALSKEVIEAAKIEEPQAGSISGKSPFRLCCL
ncbi:MAG: hypothetical protein CM1200mP30_13240 [Pseudomonadota bacterium]|nr:MAG: hypothetical protein CM1200mP30_13240 [Pseudomonadota bacterium]